MPPLLRFLMKRLLSIGLSFLVITAVLYGFMMFTSPEDRSTLYFPSNIGKMNEVQIQKMVERIIQQHHLRDPYPVQYVSWLGSLLQGEWGWSPTLQENVLPALLRRTSVTVELTIYAMLFFIPLGLVTGSLAAWRRGQVFDTALRSTAFAATSIPSFVVALLLIAFFYVGLHWFPPERLTTDIDMFVKSDKFTQYTGLVTLDGLLNRRLDITLDAFRHLVLPVIALSLVYWASLSRVTRITMLEELQKEYVVAARARGIPDQVILWRHTFRNTLAPTLTFSALSAASLFTGVFVIERIFSLKGISDMTLSLLAIGDPPAVLGFAVYSVAAVLLIMLVLDILQAIFDPRVRDGVLS
jgi:ABC-type dipeptide/oligopeptide/nickel transport system permease component